MLYDIVPDSVSRNRAVSQITILSGASVLSSQSLATVLLQAEKGKRCDTCLQVPDKESKLRRCSGCINYWYCSSSCQQKSWDLHHKRICKGLPTYLAQNKDAQDDKLMDVLLVAHLIAEHFSSEQTAMLSPTNINSAGQADLESPMHALLSLLGQRSNTRNSYPTLPPIRSSHKPPRETIEHLLDSIENNHWSVHSSYLQPIANAVFPVASRSFNHSCWPSATPSYSSRDGIVSMDLRAILDIESGDEITVPYIDPALPYPTRQELLRQSYGFTCTCKRCKAQESMPKPIKISSLSPTELKAVEKGFREHMLDVQSKGPIIPNDPLELADLPAQFYCLLDDDYLPSISSNFSQTSNDGPFEQAVETGLTMLALYLLIYPRNYPLIGLHCLEVAKTAWNMIMTNNQPVQSSQLPNALELVGALLSDAKAILSVSVQLGITGERGPNEEIELLRSLWGKEVSGE